MMSGRGGLHTRRDPNTPINKVEATTLTGDSRVDALEVIEIRFLLDRPGGPDVYLDSVYRVPTWEGFCSDFDEAERVLHRDLAGLDLDALREEGRRCLLRLDLDPHSPSWLVGRMEAIDGQLLAVSQLEEIG